MENSKNGSLHPLDSQTPRNKSNDYIWNEGSAEGRFITSEDNFAYRREEIPQREFFQTTHTQQSHHQPRQDSGQLLRPVERVNLESNNFKSTLNMSHEPIPNYIDGAFRLDRGGGFDSRIAHVDETNESYNNHLRRGEDLAPFSSEIFRPHGDQFHSERTVLVPLGRDSQWNDLHPQLIQTTQFSRQQPKTHVQPVDVVRHAGGQVSRHTSQYEVSGVSRGIVRGVESVEAFHPSFHSIPKVPDRSGPVRQDSFYSASQGSEKVSLIPSFRDDQIPLQSSRIPFNSSNSSHHAYENVAREPPSHGFTETVEYRGAGQQKYGRESQFDFARPAIESEYDGGHPKHTFDGVKTHRATLLPISWDRARTPIREEARTGVFLRELPDENRILCDDSRLRVSRSRSFRKVHKSTPSGANDLLPFQARTQDLQARAPASEEAEVKLWPSRSAHAQRYVNVFHSCNYSSFCDRKLTRAHLDMILGLNKSITVIP